MPLLLHPLSHKCIRSLLLVCLDNVMLLTATTRNKMKAQCTSPLSETLLKPWKTNSTFGRLTSKHLQNKYMCKTGVLFVKWGYAGTESSTCIFYMHGCIDHTDTAADMHLMSFLVPTEVFRHAWWRLKTEVGLRLTTEENDQLVGKKKLSICALKHLNTLR